MADYPIAVVIPAAGFGKRMGVATAKQFISVGGKTILAHTVNQIKQWAQHYQHNIHLMVALSAETPLPSDVCDVFTCIGGQTRADSVANALSALRETSHYDWALVHDAARPLVSIEEIERLYQTIKSDDVGGILAKKVNATVKRAADGYISETVSREGLWLAQTPQLFRFDVLCESLAGDRAHLTDEASGIEAMGLSPKIVEGSRDNIKVTTKEDLDYVKRALEKKG